MMLLSSASRAASDHNVLNPEHEDFDEAKRLDRIWEIWFLYLDSYSFND